MADPFERDRSGLKFVKYWCLSTQKTGSEFLPVKEDGEIHKSMKWLKDPLKVNKKNVTCINVDWTDEDGDLHVSDLAVICSTGYSQHNTDFTKTDRNKFMQSHTNFLEYLPVSKCEYIKMNLWQWTYNTNSWFWIHENNLWKQTCKMTLNFYIN